jgi:hypothetical protein
VSWRVIDPARFTLGLDGAEGLLRARARACWWYRHRAHDRFDHRRPTRRGRAYRDALIARSSARSRLPRLDATAGRARAGQRARLPRRRERARNRETEVHGNSYAPSVLRRRGDPRPPPKRRAPGESWRGWRTAAGGGAAIARARARRISRAALARRSSARCAPPQVHPGRRRFRRRGSLGGRRCGATSCCRTPPAARTEHLHAIKTSRTARRRALLSQSPPPWSSWTGRANGDPQFGRPVAVLSGARSAPSCRRRSSVTRLDSASSSPSSSRPGCSPPKNVIVSTYLSCASPIR